MNTEQTTMKFDGATYEKEHDHDRLKGQILRVYNCMRDENWRTLEQISERTGDPVASISAQLRNLRKEKFGGHTINRRSKGNRNSGLYEYQLSTLVTPEQEKELLDERNSIVSRLSHITVDLSLHRLSQVTRYMLEKEKAAKLRRLGVIIKKLP